MIELIGIIATLFILTSMLFKTTSTKGAIFMRSANLVGCIVFVIYGSLLPAISTAILNGALVIVNSFHLIRLLISIKKEKEIPSKQTEEKVENNQNLEEL